jgi:hypothetical protein
VDFVLVERSLEQFLDACVRRPNVNAQIGAS